MDFTRSLTVTYMSHALFCECQHLPTLSRQNVVCLEIFIILYVVLLNMRESPKCNYVHLRFQENCIPNMRCFRILKTALLHCVSKLRALECDVCSWHVPRLNRNDTIITTFHSVASSLFKFFMVFLLRLRTNTVRMSKLRGSETAWLMHTKV